MVPSANGLRLEAAGTLLVHRLPQATGMRRRCGDSQGHGGKCAHERQHKQQSGGQTVHDRFVGRTKGGKPGKLLVQRIGHAWPGTQVCEGLRWSKDALYFESQMRWSDVRPRPSTASPPLDR